MPKSLSIAVALILALPAAAAAIAAGATKGDITVTTAWTKATPGAATVGGGYATITNNGKETDFLVGGSFPGAASVQVHEMKMEGNIMKMRRLENGLEIPAGATVELKPGSNHLMIMGLKKPIVQGADVKGTLSFKNAGDVDVEFHVEPIGATESHHH
jgi:copper(I)-binding protein